MIKKLTLTLVAFLAVVIGFLTIAPSEMSFDDAGYNSKNVLEHLQVIADKPHSVTDYEAHEEVRQYILNVSKGFVGEENVRERNYLTPSNKNPTDGIEYVGADLVEANEIDCEYDIRNVLACLNGKSETGVLLVAHYDSRGNIKRYGELAKSYGAGDDGYGVATLLELMRYFSERKDALENSVYFLFTDSEEPNMYGSLLKSKNTELMNKVNLVINVEARGMNGAVYMFETSLKNNKVIKLFRKAESPVTYSVAPAVYSVMTNYTDFTNFLAAGKNGLNFSTLNDINDYHVPSDCYANVNTATVQHYGEQLLPIVEEYVSDAVYSDMNYFDGTHDAVFFNFLPEVFVSYSSVTAVVLAVCVLLALTALIVVGALKKQFDFKSWGKYIGFVLIGLAIAVAVGMVVSLVTARLNGYPWSLVNVRSACSDWILVLTAGAIFAVLHFAARRLLRSDGLRMFNFAAVTVQAILNLIVAIALSGASFLFLIPALAGVIYLAAEHFVKNVWGKRTVAYLSLFCIVCIFVPLIFSLQYALTIGGLAALTALAYFPFSVLLPMLYGEIREGKAQKKPEEAATASAQ